MRFYSIDPRTEEIWAEFTSQETLLEKQIASSALAQNAWRKKSVRERIVYFQALAKELRTRKEHYAHLITREMGKLLEESLAEVEKCASCADYYSENAEIFLSDEMVRTEAKKSYVMFEPMGIVLAIMPWNFPLWQAFRASIPALLAGNALLLKHASNVSSCSLAVQEAFERAGFPKGLMQSLLLSGDQASLLLADARVSAVSFTGSTQVGKKIAAIAGAHLKKAVLELGGSDAYVVLQDADLAKAAQACAHSRLINAGQSCIAAKRFIVEESIAKDFLPLFQKELEAKKLAPLARSDLRQELHQQVTRALEEGAELACGGAIPTGKGFYYPASILLEMHPGMESYQEEFFGPVALVAKAKDAEHALFLANETSFGLGGAIFSRNLARAEQLVREELACGSAFVNTFVRSDARLPFGGTKESGFGRELSHYGLKEFTHIKTIFVE